GFGSQFREVVPARTEAEMRRNRRIEIFITQTNVPPPAPKPPPAPPTPKPPDTGTVWKIQIKSGAVTSIGLPLPDEVIAPSSLNFIINVVITDVLRKQQANFRVLATGVGLPGGQVLLSPITTTNLTQGDPADFTSIAATNLGLFEGEVDITQDPGFALSAFSR